MRTAFLFSVLEWMKFPKMTENCHKESESDKMASMNSAKSTNSKKE